MGTIASDSIMNFFLDPPLRLQLRSPHRLVRSG
jgi:hypothetical protein